jgi:hypothetical protein
MDGELPEPSAPAGWYLDSERPGQLRYWDGRTWTDLRTPPLPPASKGSRAPTIAVVAVASLLVVVASVGLYQCATNPAIARMRGVVTSVTEVPDRQVEVCIRDATDAGSTYGDRNDRDSLCWDGFLEGMRPKVGDCVVLQAQGESATLKVEAATGCE